MENLIDTIFEYFLLSIAAMILIFVAVATFSSFVDTGMFQVDSTAQTVDTFQRYIENSLK